MAFNFWVAGSAGEIDTFNIDCFDHLNIDDEHVDRIRVMRNGDIQIMDFNDDATNCVCYFEQNKFLQDQLEGIPTQLDRAIMFEFGIRNFSSMNIIGFSNGGNASARWIVRCGQYRPFRINNFVTISTPFNGDALDATPNGFLKEMKPHKAVFSNISCHHFQGISDSPAETAQFNVPSDGVIAVANAETCIEVTGVKARTYHGYNHGTAQRIPDVTALLSTFL